MRLKVKTINLTPEQQEGLQHYGCEPTPFITWPSALIFAANCTNEQEQGLRDLECVIEVEPMPRYGIA